MLRKLSAATVAAILLVPTMAFAAQPAGDTSGAQPGGGISGTETGKETMGAGKGTMGAGKEPSGIHPGAGRSGEFGYNDRGENRGMRSGWEHGPRYGWERWPHHGRYCAWKRGPYHAAWACRG